MTACSIITQGATGYLATDTGWFWDDGRLAAVRSKVVTVPALRFALAVRGAPIDMAGAIELLQPPSVDSLMASLPELTAAVIRKAMQSAPGMVGPDDWSTSLFVVHWDQRLNRAVGAFMASEAGNATPPGYVPWTWQRVQECLAPGVDLTAIFGSEPDTANPSLFPIDAGAIAIIEGQRRERWSVNAGPLAHRVGGAVELTTVTATSVTTRTLRTWPDVVGKTINAEKPER